MAIPGGSAAKWGELYEGRWTVFTLLRVLDEDANAIRIEQPGEDFAAFVVRINGETEYHQAKRAYAQSGRWSIKTLLRQGVLVPFKEKLESGGHNRCVFVSGQDADHLRALSYTAIRLTGLLTEKPWKRGFFYGPDSPATRQARSVAG